MPAYVQPPPPTAGVTGLVGSLVLIDVIGFTRDVQTAYGIKDEVDVKVTVVLNEQNPTLVGTVTVTKVYNTVLVSQFRNLVGQTTLGRLGMGQARAGNHAPIRLDPPTAQDEQAADAFLAQSARPGLPPAAAQSPVGGPGPAIPPGYPPAPPQTFQQPPAGYPAVPAGFGQPGDAPPF